MIQTLRKAKAGALIISLLVKLVRRLSLNSGSNRQALRAPSLSPQFHVTDERRADPRPACVFQHDEGRKPRDRTVVVNRRKEVSRNQPDDFTISVGRDKGGRVRIIADRTQAVRNLRDWCRIAKLCEQLTENGSVSWNGGSDGYGVSHRTPDGTHVRALTLFTASAVSAEERLERAPPGVVPQLEERLLLDLAHPLPRDLQQCADILESHWVGAVQ